MQKYETVIGLEVHSQLRTESKIFASSSAAAGKQANTLCDSVTLGLPGCLPVLNKRVVEFAIRLGLATSSSIERESLFARKHYFYPDLPKGYQISQYDKPICLNGKVDVRIKGETKSIRLTRIHLEEDAGKNIHSESAAVSFVDLNRSGVPLVEIVTEPDLRSTEEAGAFMRQLRQIVRYLDICDGNMEEGSLRCDANISLRPQGETSLGTKVEIKNLNSFRFVEKALEYEIHRQSMLLDQKQQVMQETRLWDAQKNVTLPMRSKEYAEDYRYFSDPDLLPLVIDNQWIEKVRSDLPELPNQTFERFKSIYGLDDYYASLLTEEKSTARYYDQAVSMHYDPSTIASWIITELFGRLNREGLEMAHCPVSPENLACLVELINKDVISGKIAKTVFDEMFTTSASPLSIVESKGLKQISDVDLLKKVVNQIIDNNPEQARQYRGGKTKMLGYFVGQIMKETQGKANPQIVNVLLLERLTED